MADRKKQLAKRRAKKAETPELGTVHFHECEKCGAEPAAYRRYLSGKVLCTPCAIKQMALVAATVTAAIAGFFLI